VGVYQKETRKISTRAHGERFGRKRETNHDVVDGNARGQTSSGNLNRMKPSWLIRRPVEARFQFIYDIRAVTVTPSHTTCGTSRNPKQKDGVFI
jgi:hypothetical protein